MEWEAIHSTQMDSRESQPSASETHKSSELINADTPEKVEKEKKKQAAEPLAEKQEPTSEVPVTPKQEYSNLARYSKYERDFESLEPPESDDSSDTPDDWKHDKPDAEE